MQMLLIAEWMMTVIQSFIHLGPPVKEEIRFIQTYTYIE